MSKLLRQRFLEHVAQTSPAPMALEVERAEGVFLYAPPSEEFPRGKRYFDLVSGVSVSNVGHGCEAVVRAVREQAAAYMHTMVYGETVMRVQVRYAERLAEVLAQACESAGAGRSEQARALRGGLLAASGKEAEEAASGRGNCAGDISPRADNFSEAGSGRLESVYFVNSGAEAIEGALKLAKRVARERDAVRGGDRRRGEEAERNGEAVQDNGGGVPQRSEILAFRRAYHGSTHGALSLMSSPEGDEWRVPFEPLLPDVDWLEFNDFEGLSRIGECTACVVVEPVQGEAGVRLPELGFLQALRAKCDEEGAVLIFDEIQTGMGRTGQMFAFEKYGVVPDVLCLAKALGGGMPLGAFVASREMMGLLSHDPALGHITTFGGNAVCCAAGLAAMEYIIDRGLVDGVEAKGALFEELLSGHRCVAEIRRAGLLMAVELVGGSGEEDASGRMYRLMELFLERGIMSDWFLFCDTAFRISPPLVISEEEIRECCGVIRECLDRL